MSAARTDRLSPEAVNGWSLPRAVIPLIVVAGTLILTVLAAITVANNVQTRDRLRFRNSVRTSIHEITSQIDLRTREYEALLRGLAGFFTADREVTPQEFAAFVEKQHLETHYKGILGIGFARWLPTPQIDPFVQQMRSQGVLDFKVWPKSDYADHAIVAYLLPPDPDNQRVVGFDMSSEPTRRQAMEDARDNGTCTASRKIQLIQEGENRPRPGLLILLPVYRGAPTTLQQRRDSLIGFVYCPFRADDLLGDIIDSDEDSVLEYAVYDGIATTPEHLLFHSPSTGGPNFSAANGYEELAPKQVIVAGRPWTLTFAARPQFGPSTGWVAGGAVLGLGILISGILFLATHSLVKARGLAELTAAKLRRSERGMAESERRFRTFFEQSPLSIQIFAADGTAILANRAWNDLWEADPQKTRHYNLLKDPQILGSGYADQIRTAFSGSPVTLPPVLYDPTISGFSGRPRWVQAHLYPVKDGGELREVVLILQDVTDLHVVEEDRNRLLAAERAARAEAESANRTKDEFLATLSHELRTPLNAILGWAQLLAVGGVEGEEFTHALETIERNAKVQAQLIEDLLDLSRIISGKLRLELEKVDLPAAVEAALDSVRPTAEAKGVRLVPILDSHATPVLGDPNRLQQVVWNLLSNAIKFTPKGGKVQLFLQATGDQAEIVVSDTGQGIKAEFLPYVFDRLRQQDASSTRRHGGLGLGLAIVRHLVELHGGSVAAESRGENKGATFSVRIPLADPRRLAGRESASRALAQNRDGALNGVRILVVDDEADARELVGHILRRSGAQVTAVGTAREAFDLMGELHPDILISDLSMPEEDGYSLIRRIRSLQEGQGGRVPAVALTALARNEDRRQALLAGYQMHLAKPIEPAELTATVATLVKGL